MMNIIQRGLAAIVGFARRSDPDTSQAAASISQRKLSDRILDLMQDEPMVGWTGKELAAALDAPLNSVTPRLAPMVRAGWIRDTGYRRNKQIIWMAALNE